MFDLMKGEGLDPYSGPLFASESHPPLKGRGDESGRLKGSLNREELRDRGDELFALFRVVELDPYRLAEEHRGVEVTAALRDDILSGPILEVIAQDSDTASGKIVELRDDERLPGRVQSLKFHVEPHLQSSLAVNVLVFRKDSDIKEPAVVDPLRRNIRPAPQRDQLGKR